MPPTPLFLKLFTLLVPEVEVAMKQVRREAAVD
jgi:hypothetical protein